MQSCIKEEHFWHFRDEVMSNFHQQPNEQKLALNTRITTLVNNCKFQDHHSKETIKFMLLQHAVNFTRQWIGLDYKIKHNFNIFSTSTTLQSTRAMLQTIPKGQSIAHDVDTTNPKATALHQASNAITAMEQATSQPFADDPEAPATPGTDTGKAGPAKEGPAATDAAVTPTAETGSLTNGATTTFLLLHVDHLTT